MSALIATFAGVFIKIVKDVGYDMFRKANAWYKEWVKRRKSITLLSILVVVGVVDGFLLPILDTALWFADEIVVAWICCSPVLELFRRLVRYAHSKGVAIPEQFHKMLVDVQKTGEDAAKQTADRAVDSVTRRIPEAPRQTA
jgi:hypothetical protein